MKKLAIAGLSIIVIVAAVRAASHFWCSQSPRSEAGSHAVAPTGIDPVPAAQTMVAVPPTIESASPATRTPPPATVANTPITQPTASAILTPLATTSTGPSPEPQIDPFDLVSQKTLFAFLDDLTAIQPYSGWRNSGSQGEREALDYVNKKLSTLAYLGELGVEFERQEFPVFLATELRQTRLHLVVNGQEFEVPADGLRGPRDDVGQALRFDSDGALNDTDPDPLVVEGQVLFIRSAAQARDLGKSEIQGKVVFLDYAAIDRIVQDDLQKAVEVAWQLIDKDPAGVVLVTRFSNQVGEGHGAFVGDLSALNYVRSPSSPPVLYARLEDLAVAGIEDWDELAEVELARLTWDADVFSPGISGNLVARIPGSDPSRALILGAHIDSPNSPGAMDDGSGSAILLEIARVLDASRTQPPTDLYLAWFGSEELGLYGGAHFVATHQELLDRTQAMLQIDCLTRPLDGIEADITLVSWSYRRLGDDRLLWPQHLEQVSAEYGSDVKPQDLLHTYSDNSTFGAYDVPHADMIYVNEQAMEAAGSLHYAAHIHDPYDTVDQARQVGDVFEEMARVALAAALEPPSDLRALRAPPRPDRRALFIASHTEAVHMTPSWYTDLGMALAMAGLDVDLVPYGQPVTAEDLEDTDLVITLPVLDYPTLDTNLNLYDEVWAPEEISALEGYVAGGGLLVLTNSAHRLKYGIQMQDRSEDVLDTNALASAFGLTYQGSSLAGDRAQTEGDHPLVSGIASLTYLANNAVPLDPPEKNGVHVLAKAGGQPVVVLADHGHRGGQVLALADVGMLGSTWQGPENLPFWRNLAEYARR